MNVDYCIVEDFIKGKTKLPVYSDSCHACQNLHACPVTSGTILEGADHTRSYSRGLRQEDGRVVLVCSEFKYNKDLSPELKLLRDKVILSKHFRCLFEEVPRDLEADRMLSLESSRL